MARNGHLSYTENGTSHSLDIYINSTVQPFGVNGSSSQSRLVNQFFPRGNQLGNMTITAKATSQDEYQSFARFVREHQLTIVNTSGINFANLSSIDSGYQRLMGLTIDGELVSLRGWIPSFTLTKKGIYSFAPEFTFDFYVVFDLHSVPIATSVMIADAYASSSNATNQTQPNGINRPPDAITANDPTIMHPNVGL